MTRLGRSQVGYKQDGMGSLEKMRLPSMLRVSRIPVTVLYTHRGGELTSAPNPTRYGNVALPSLDTKTNGQQI